MTSKRTQFINCAVKQMPLGYVMLRLSSLCIRVFVCSRLGLILLLISFH